MSNAPSFLSDSTPSATNVGVGVPASSGHTADDFLLDRFGFKEYSNKPIFADQYNMSDQIKRGELKHGVFNLSNEEDAKKYEEIISKTSPANPSIEITVQDRHFYRGSFYVYLEYCPVYYKLPNKK